MEMHFYFTVAFIWLFAAMTPGLNFFITIQMAMSGSYKESFCTVLGIVTGTFIWAVLGYEGLTIAFKVVPNLYYLFKIISGLYLSYLGIKLLISNKKHCFDNTRIPEITLKACFLKGLFTNVLNPKTALFIASLFAAAIPPNHSLQTGTLSVLIMCSISMCWYMLVATLFSGVKVKHFYEVYRGIVEKVAGGMFVFFGLRLALSK